MSVYVLRMQKDYFGYSRTSHIQRSNLFETHLHAGMLFEKYKCKTSVAALHSVFTHLVNYVRRCIRMSSSVWLLPTYLCMLLDEMLRNDFEEISQNPKVNESLNPDSFRSFLHKVTECNQISILVVRIQNYYFGKIPK